MSATATTSKLAIRDILFVLGMKLGRHEHKSRSCLVLIIHVTFVSRNMLLGTGKARVELQLPTLKRN